MLAQWQGIDFKIYQKLEHFVNLYQHKEVIAMSYRNNNNKSVPFVKIVYSKVKVNGKIELVPMEWYADGSVKKCG
jgi:hypothetical protein